MEILYFFKILFEIWLEKCVFLKRERSGRKTKVSVRGIGALFLLRRDDAPESALESAVYTQFGHHDVTNAPGGGGETEDEGVVRGTRTSVVSRRRY